MQRRRPAGSSSPGPARAASRASAPRDGRRAPPAAPARPLQLRRKPTLRWTGTGQRGRGARGTAWLAPWRHMSTWGTTRSSRGRATSWPQSQTPQSWSSSRTAGTPLARQWRRPTRARPGTARQCEAPPCCPRRCSPRRGSAPPKRPRRTLLCRRLRCRRAPQAATRRRHPRAGVARRALPSEAPARTPRPPPRTSTSAAASTEFGGSRSSRQPSKPKPRKFPG
mmetsp:Transcript_3157/g.13008  ORF Transcript_3157/g.13008 Transcript_3157/m.13008 type:complete len:224 (-) Transcript_3157:1307-1978(-)